MCLEQLWALEHLGKSSVSSLRISFVYSSIVEGINKFMLVSTYANCMFVHKCEPGLLRSQNTYSRLTRHHECARNYSDMMVM